MTWRLPVGVPVPIRLGSPPAPDIVTRPPAEPVSADFLMIPVTSTRFRSVHAHLTHDVTRSGDAKSPAGDIGAKHHAFALGTRRRREHSALQASLRADLD